MRSPALSSGCGCAGKQMIEAMNHMGVDLVNIGNHDVDFGMNVLEEQMSRHLHVKHCGVLVRHLTCCKFGQTYLRARVAGLIVESPGLHSTTSTPILEYRRVI
eukprot:6466429-Amphidinium_carterae.1